MQVKLLHDLVDEMAGTGNGAIVEILFGKKDVNEFLIAKKMNLTINQVRNILYKLSAEGLVTFIRKKDKKKGWYIYFWTLKTEKCLVKLEQSLLKKIEEFNVLLTGRETKRFYVCKPCNIEVSEEKALENDFTCEECVEVYTLSDNTKPIKDVKAKITRVQNELSLIQKELVDIREKDRKKKVKSDKKAEKEEATKKALLKAARAAARKLVARKEEKKKVKKKPEKKGPAKKKEKKTKKSGK